MNNSALQYEPFAVETVMEVIHDETRDMAGAELMATLEEMRNRIDAQVQALKEPY